VIIPSYNVNVGRGNFQPLFQGKHGESKREPELLPGSKPFCGKPFSIPKAYQQVTEDNIAQLESIGPFTKMTSSKWAAPTCIIPKKKNTICIITDFWGLTNA
jgi:hypothetical protein